MVPTQRSVNINAAAALLNVSRRTVYYRIASGRLATVKVGASTRVLLSAIDDAQRARKYERKAAGR
jgi:excisionase family DNA binding protein